MRPRTSPLDGTRHRRLLLAILGFAIGAALALETLVLPTTANGGSISADLERVLDDPLHTLRQANGQLAVWVYFRARELTPGERELALARAETALSEKVAMRRGKLAAPGQRLVDDRDLPLDRRHLDAALATGASPREKSRWLGAGSYDATPAQVRALAELPEVRRVSLVKKTAPRSLAYAQPDRAETPPAAKRWTLDYGPSQGSLELINVPPVHELGYTGAGVLVAMLDSGFHMAHEALDHVPVIAAYDVVDDDGIVDTEPGDPADTHEHGTIVISAALAYAPGSLIGPAYAASAILVRAEHTAVLGQLEEDRWVAALEWAELQGPDVVSSSLGYWDAYQFSDLDGDTAASTVAADMAAGRGLLIINAAGNQGGLEFDHVVAPADADSVIAVGAVEISGVVAVGSSSGPTYDGRIKPDVMAQGIGVNAADPYDDFGYLLSGGTSLAAPFVSGVAALILERAPFLNPMQVREALRETASYAALPNNDYGWGILDALAAVFYWGPQITHTELPDSEDPVGPYTVTAAVSDQFALDAQTPWLRYRVDGGGWQDVLMSAQGGGNYTADIPGQPSDSVVEYYLEASDVQGLSARHPLMAPTELFSFRVWEDLIPPLVEHAPLLNQGLGNWPPYVTARVTDDLRVDAVTLRYAVNAGPERGPFTLVRGINDLFALAFPVDVGNLSTGDVLSYTLTAVDAAASGNTTVIGPFAFTILAGAGEILVFDDDAGSNEAATVSTWLVNAGYSTLVRSTAAYLPSDFDGKQAVVILSGDNASPLESITLRQFIESWVAGGGRLLIEGGEVGFAMHVLPGDTSFARDVLHTTSWNADAAGSLVAVSGQANHPLLQGPPAVAPPLALNYTSESDQDAMVPAADAHLVLENATTAGTAGALIFDDNPIDPAPQIVYYPFALAALSDQSQAEALVLNALARLLYTGPPTAVDEDPQGDGVRPRVTRLLNAVPSPFNARTVLRLELAEDGPARLVLYDVRGRLVRTLLDGASTLAAGPHERVWDGRDRFGRDVASGTYLVRLQANGVQSAGKVALVR